MKLLTVLTPRVIDNKGPNGRRSTHPQFARDYPTKATTDITGQPGNNIPSSPNQYVLAALVEDSVADQVADDGFYEVLTEEDA